MDTQSPQKTFDAHSDYDTSDTLTQENTRIHNFPLLSNSELLELARSTTPSMTRSDFYFCQQQYKKQKKSPSVAELRMINALLEERKRSTEHDVLSYVQSEDHVIAQTYQDMMAKLRVLSPEKKIPPSLSEAAAVSARYMRRIGRTDTASALSTNCQDKTDYQLRAKSSFPSVSTTSGLPLLRLSNKDASPLELLPSGTAFVIVCPKAATGDGTSGYDYYDYEEKLKSFLADEEIPSLYMGSVRVNRFGILYTLARLCKGVFADLRQLPHMEEPLALSCLVKNYRGCLLLSAERANTAQLVELAKKHDLSAAYFAKATESGWWRTSQEASVFLDMKLSFILSLANGKSQGNFVCPAENLRSACHHLPLSVTDDEGSIGKTEGADLLRADGHLLAPVFSEAKDACFSNALNTVLDAVLRLICRGINRRAITLAFTYLLPYYGKESQDSGKDLSLILGAYRAAIELACPQKAPTVKYTDQPRALCCTAYAPIPHRELSDTFQRSGSNFYYLSFRRDPNGLPDFESFRQMCDSFFGWLTQGKIFSACPILGSLPSAVYDMATGGEIQFSSLSEEYKNFFCQGILFEASDIPELRTLGTVLSLPAVSTPSSVSDIPIFSQVSPPQSQKKDSLPVFSDEDTL